MEWVIGLIIVAMIFGSSKEKRCGKRDASWQDRTEKDKEIYHMQAEMDRMRERMNAMERIITDEDLRLRREFRNL